MLGQFDELNRLTASTSGRYSEAQAQAVAVQLSGPLTPDRAAVQTIAYWLARKQLDCQEGRIHALDSAKLLASVNRELGVERSPDLLLRDEELQKTRAFLRSRVPGLIGDDPSRMTPFEAMFAVNQLVRFKMADIPIPQAAPTVPPAGARLVASNTPFNAASHPFMVKVMNAWRKWPTAAAGLQALEKVLAESQ